MHRASGPLRAAHRPRGRGDAGGHLGACAAPQGGARAGLPPRGEGRLAPRVLHRHGLRRVCAPGARPLAEQHRLRGVRGRRGGGAAREHPGAPRWKSRPRRGPQRRDARRGRRLGNRGKCVLGPRGAREVCPTHHLGSVVQRLTLHVVPRFDIVPLLPCPRTHGGLDLRHLRPLCNLPLDCWDVLPVLVDPLSRGSKGNPIARRALDRRARGHGHLGLLLRPGQAGHRADAVPRHGMELRGSSARDREAAWAQRRQIIGAWWRLLHRWRSVLRPGSTNFRGARPHIVAHLCSGGQYHPLLLHHVVCDAA
mmetsp:Transcript_66862/g.217439  ORF Transcript_66862/g.217439 Transcript_66862/m.217439 type:complete len:309 (+) Transcript_66862:458-1384(+)